MAILHGRNLRIMKAGTGSADVAVVAAARSCEVNTEAEMIETSSVSSSDWRTFKAGRKTWQVTVSYLVTAGQLAEDVLAVGTSVSLKFYDENDNVMTGDALIQRSGQTGTIGNLAQGSWVFLGNGPLSAVSNSE